MTIDIFFLYFQAFFIGIFIALKPSVLFFLEDYMIKKKIIILISIFICFYLFNDEFKIDDYSKMNNDQLKIEEKLVLNENDSFKKFANLGLIYFFMNDKEKIKFAIDNFEKSLTINKNSLIKAYLGSSYTKLGKNENDLNLKVKYVNKGLKIMDEAYKENSNYGLSILLANNFIELPDNIFHRLKNANKIIDTLLKKVDSFTREQQAQIIFLKAKINFKQSKKDEAIKLYKIIISEYNDTKYNELALSELKKYGVIK